MTIPFQEYNRITTDDTLRETVSHGSGSYPFAYYLEDAWQFDFHCIDWHWHHEVEFATVTRGKLLCQIGEDKIELSEGFGLFINSGVLHRFEAVCEETILPNIVFSPALLAPEESLIYEKYVIPVLNSTAAYQLFSPEIEWQNEILNALRQIYYFQEMEEKNELLTMQMILKIWNALFESIDIASETLGMRHINPRQAKLRIMMQYIHDHYETPIALEDIAFAASVSKSSALNIFQTGIHMPPVSYLIQYRLKCASHLLCTTEKSVSAIAAETGFSTAGYFCRKFKEHYHMSPNEYKRNRLNQHELN
ncbi:MAG: AraC family transcriptional regulator [Lachnospiraceae bacterium]|nr:AraC family transcriptional regulator [Lachnospiraceae bacterium]